MDEDNGWRRMIARQADFSPSFPWRKQKSPDGLDTLVYSGDTAREVLPPALGVRPVLPLPAGDLEARVGDHAPPLALGGEPIDALDEVLVAVPVAGDDLADQRYRCEGPALVDGVEGRVVDLAELEAGEDASRLEDAKGLAQGARLVRKVADAEGDCVQIYAVRGDRGEVLCVGLEEAQSACRVVRGGGEAFLALGEHGRVDIRDGDVGGVIVVDGRGVVQHALRNVAGAASDVEDGPPVVRRRGARVQTAHKPVLPEAVYAERH